MSGVDAPAAADRFAPRRLAKSGDRSRDGRGRVRTMPPILHYGFRPFFFLAAVHAGLAIPAWLWLHLRGGVLPGSFAGLDWHVHEMLFGYLAAVIAGFLLTAIPNWTGRLPLSGWPLAGLVGLWLAGRAATTLLADPVAAMAVDLAFPSVLALSVWREVLAGRNWRNAPVAIIITLFGAANALHHAGNLDLVPQGLGTRLALAAVAMLIALIGGRIVPSFTRNFLARTGTASLPTSFGWLDKAALAATGLALSLWIAVPDEATTAAGMALAGALLLARLVRWRGHRTLGEPIVLVLHLGYLWLAAALLLFGASLAGFLPQSSALHALTAGAIGTMTLAVMTRASLGHTGRAIVADRSVQAIYALVTLGAALRVAAPLAPDLYIPLLATGGTLWSASFLLFAIRYAPVLWGRRAA
ncbi:NnrS family protein [Aquibium sp. ELW1220]|uniref:NnrS family protein n=1 Tax=Aquibium sp. ELW1220 TaxID=2976766 RepID=UPI0025B1DC61|nr:NnrS family protein [Aquibium sp. ELW1220]MDN2582245.1 NnrS family protein [Aquibium sp. ELW1220]